MRQILIAALASVCAVATAHATSISPMIDKGVTFADRKAVMVTVANAYSSTQTIKIEAFEPDLATPAPGVKLAVSEITLASNERRRFRVIFDVPHKEREIAICVQSEAANDDMVIPRVCGRFFARRAGHTAR